MEFRCRLASPSGEITEGIYVAETEARLRHEFEEKGLFVLSLQPKGTVAGSLSEPSTENTSSLTSTAVLAAGVAPTCGSARGWRASSRTK